MKKKSIVIIVIVAAATISSLLLGGLALASQDIDVVSTYFPGSIPLTDPNSPLWEQAAEVQIPMGSQTVIAPMRPTPSVPFIKVRSLNNGTHIAFLMAWVDSTKNDRAVKIDEFRDSGAVLISPPGQAALLAMGTVLHPVNILHWKADWQTDIDAGFQDLQSAFPNFWVDVYPSAVGKPPYNLPTAFPDAAKLYLPGWHVGNPLSEPLKVTPIEEANAKGFGSLATQRQQDALGRGVWEDGRWKVVIARGMATGDGDDVKISSSTQYNVAFAVWEGESGDVGARKTLSALLTMVVQR